MSLNFKTMYGVQIFEVNIVFYLIFQEIQMYFFRIFLYNICQSFHIIK